MKHALAAAILAVAEHRKGTQYLFLSAYTGTMGQMAQDKGTRYRFCRSAGVALAAVILAVVASAVQAAEPAARVGDVQLDYLVSKRAQTIETLARVLLSEKKTAEARALLEPEAARLEENGSGTPDAVKGPGPIFLPVSLDEVRLVYLLGVVEEMTGSPAKRDERYALARKLTPGDERSHLLLGEAFEKMHREDIAKFEYAAALDAPPADSPLDALALARMASLEQTNRRWAAAADLWEKLSRLIARVPELAVRAGISADRIEYSSRVASGWMLVESGKPEDRAAAVKACESAWRIDPEGIEACVLGERVAAATTDAARREDYIESWRRRSDYALVTLRSRVAANPTDPVHYNNLAWFCAELGRNLKEGVGAIGRALELRPTESMFIDTLAELQFRSGDPAAAAKTIRRVVDLHPYANDYYRRQLERFEPAPKKDAAP
jgi:tetratricopeptide (TPR) repeat protein